MSLSTRAPFPSAWRICSISSSRFAAAISESMTFSSGYSSRATADSASLFIRLIDSTSAFSWRSSISTESRRERLRVPPTMPITLPCESR
ncbi:hypothetical protein D3C76_1630080 [compost metagenome]